MSNMRELIEKLTTIKADKARGDVDKIVKGYIQGLKSMISGYESGKKRIVDAKILMMAMARIAGAIGGAIASHSGEKSGDIEKLSRELGDISKKITAVKVDESEASKIGGAIRELEEYSLKGVSAGSMPHEKIIRDDIQAMVSSRGYGVVVYDVKVDGKKERVYGKVIDMSRWAHKTTQESGIQTMRLVAVVNGNDMASKLGARAIK
jgi:hypothetical protein